MHWKMLIIIYHMVHLPHFSTLAWKIPWMEEPGRPQSMGSLRVGHDWVTSLSLFTFMFWRRKQGLVPARGLPAGYGYCQQHPINSYSLQQHVDPVCSFLNLQDKLPRVPSRTPGSGLFLRVGSQLRGAPPLTQRRQCSLRSTLFLRWLNFSSSGPLL